MQNSKIALFGLDRAGKTIIANYLGTGTINMNFKPTLAVNYSQMFIDRVKYAIMDLPGQKNLRTLWAQSCDNCNCLIFTLDTSDEARYPEADAELSHALRIMKNKDYFMIFLFNKMDLEKSKKNLPDAKLFFNETTIVNMGCTRVTFLETTAYDVKSLDQIARVIVGNIGQACLDNASPS